jgi:hypothetical protein
LRELQARPGPFCRDNAQNWRVLIIWPRDVTVILAFSWVHAGRLRIVAGVNRLAHTEPVQTPDWQLSGEV